MWRLLRKLLTPLILPGGWKRTGDAGLFEVRLPEAVGENGNFDIAKFVSRGTLETQNGEVAGGNCVLFLAEAMVELRQLGLNKYISPNRGAGFGQGV